MCPQHIIARQLPHLLCEPVTVLRSTCIAYPISLCDQLDNTKY